MIGRKEEIEVLNDRYNSNKAEFIAIYGRRRVGKTYLIDETFKGRITFRHAGLSPSVDNKEGVLKAQLDHFYESLLMQGMEKGERPKSWMSAFVLLEKHLQKIDDGTRRLIFIDELPWLDTPRSKFVMALEAFWNNWACHRHNIMLVVCGSSSSWILDNLINNHGGLYNRLTFQIHLKPFTLKECEEYYRENNIIFSRYDIVQSYMILGGIPYYMGYMNNKFSLAQNVDNMFFTKASPLKDEFDRLFDSIFDKPELMKSIVKLLYKKNAGYTRSEIMHHLKLGSGGHLTNQLTALINGNFIEKYVPFGFSKREEHYKLVDPFCLFYLHFVAGRKGDSETYWQDHLESQEVVVWRGFAFENVCFNHIKQIKKALGIAAVSTSISSWSKRKDNDENGLQIDMLIIRKDNVINMCEIKFYDNEFVVNEAYSRTLKARKQTLRDNVSPKYAIQGTLITTHGLKFNAYSGEFIHCVTLDDLFD